MTKAMTVLGGAPVALAMCAALLGPSLAQADAAHDRKVVKLRIMHESDDMQPDYSWIETDEILPIPIPDWPPCTPSGACGDHYSVVNLNDLNEDMAKDGDPGYAATDAFEAQFLPLDSHATAYVVIFGTTSSGTLSRFTGSSTTLTQSAGETLVNASAGAFFPGSSRFVTLYFIESIDQLLPVLSLNGLSPAAAETALIDLEADDLLVWNKATVYYED